MSYQDVKNRLYQGHKKMANNTYLTLHEGDDSFPYPEAIKMRLHDNTVAIFNQEFMELYSAGYYTITTRSRLNLALELAHIKPGVYQVDYQWYYGNTNHKHDPKFYGGMKIDYMGRVIN